MKVEIRPEAAVAALQQALILVAATPSGRLEMYTEESNRLLSEILSGVEIGEDATTVLADRVAHTILGLAIVASWSMHELERQGVDRLELMKELGEAGRAYFRAGSRYVPAKAA